MSLIKLPLRLVSVRALRDLTYAGDAVFDSAIVPLETKVADAKGVPLIVVYTDDAHASPEGWASHDLAGFRPTVSLKFHAAVATEIKSSSGEVVVARSDEGFEATLDIMEAQILRVLQKGQGPWSELWRSLVIRADERHVRRGASALNGLHFAAREIEVPIESHPDPLGEGLEWPWNAVIDAFAADAELDGLATILLDFCTAEVAAPQWQRDLGNLGADRATALALGFVTAAGEELVFP